MVARATGGSFGSTEALRAFIPGSSTPSSMIMTDADVVSAWRSVHGGESQRALLGQREEEMEREGERLAAAKPRASDGKAGV